MEGDQDTSKSLICAVREGRVERKRELVCSYGLSYSQAWADGYVLLFYAVGYEHTEVAKLLLTNGAKVNIKTKKLRDTPLHIAARTGNIEIVQMLLDGGANINAVNQYCITPLHNAVKSKKMETVELLLNQGANVNARYIDSKTPLHLAVERGCERITKLLLSRAANVDAEGKGGGTYIHIAVERG